MNIWKVLKSLKKSCQLKKRFIALWPVKNSDKEYEHVHKDLGKFEMKTMKDYHKWHLKCHVLLLADVFEKLRNSSLKNYG